MLGNQTQKVDRVGVFRFCLSFFAPRVIKEGYSGQNFARAVKQVCGEQVRVEVIGRTTPTFEQLPKRWIVERTFGWLNRFRRLSKDYEVYSEVSEAMIYGSW
jgi:putative transposase